MVPALLSLLLLLAPPPDLQTWREHELPAAQITVETPGELVSQPLKAEAGISQRKQWQARRGDLILTVNYLKRASASPLSPRQYLETYGNAWVKRTRTARMVLAERTVLGKPAVELKINDSAKTGVNFRSWLLRDGLEEWRYEASYAASKPGRAEEAEHFFDSIRPLSTPELPRLVSQKPGSGLTIAVPGKLDAEKQPLPGKKKGVKSKTLHSLTLPDRSVFYVFDTVYQEGFDANLKRDFLGLLNLALAKSKQKVAPKIEVINLQNASGYRTRNRTWVGDTEFTYRIATFTAGQHGYGVLVMAPNTVRHDKLLDDVLKSLKVARR